MSDVFLDCATEFIGCCVLAAIISGLCFVAVVCLCVLPFYGLLYLVCSLCVHWSDKRYFQQCRVCGKELYHDRGIFQEQPK